MACQTRSASQGVSEEVFDRWLELFGDYPAAPWLSTNPQAGMR